MLSDVFDLQNLGFFSCDTWEVFGDTQMCRDTQFEKHWHRETTLSSFLTELNLSIFYIECKQSCNH